MRFIIAAVLATLVAGPALAQQLSPLTGTTASPPAPSTTTTTAPAAAARPARPHHPRMTMQQRFDAANTSHDGKLTLDQAKAGKMARVATNFDAIDTTKKGYVTIEDIHTFNKAQRAARKPAAT